MGSAGVSPARESTKEETALNGARCVPIVEPAQVIDFTSIVSPLRRAGKPDRIIIWLHPRRTEVTLAGESSVLADDAPTFTGPLAAFKQVADQPSTEAFHITAYLFTVGGTEKIRVELSGPRVKGRKTWKRTRSFRSEQEALRYVTDEGRAFDSRALPGECSGHKAT